MAPVTQFQVSVSRRAIKHRPLGGGDSIASHLGSSGGHHSAGQAARLQRCLRVWDTSGCGAFAALLRARSACLDGMSDSIASVHPWRGPDCTAPGGRYAAAMARSAVSMTSQAVRSVLDALEGSSSTDSSRGSVACKATAKEAGQGGRVAPAEPDTLVETGAGITLLKESANHARRPPERPGKVPSALWVQKLDMILS